MAREIKERVISTKAPLARLKRESISPPAERDQQAGVPMEVTGTRKICWVVVDI